VEFVTNTAIAAYVHVLERLGLTPPVLGRLREATVHNLSIPLLRFQGRVSCRYVGQEERKVVVAEREVERNVSGSAFLPNSASTETTKVKKTVPQYLWDVQFSYNVTALEGGGKGDQSSHILLRSGTNSQAVFTRVKKSPLDQGLDRTLVLPLTWLLQHLSPPAPTSEVASLTTTFSIDRLDASCKTPRRNDNVRDALAFDRDLHAWASRVKEYMLRVDRLQRSSQDTDDDTSTRPHPMDKWTSGSSKSRLAGLLESSDMFFPIVPLIENQTVMLSDADAILAEHVRSVDAALENLHQAYGANTESHPGQSNESLIESDEAGVALLCHHLAELSQSYVPRIYD
jgi:hypothetical protein